MTADDAVGGGIDNQLHQNPRVAAGQRCLDRLEVNFVDIDVTELRARLRLRQSHRADLGLGKHRSWSVDMVDLDRPLAKHRIRERVTLADRDRRQVEAMSDVADRVYIRRRGARESIDRQPAMARIDAEAAGLEPEIAR